MKYVKGKPIAPKARAGQKEPARVLVPQPPLPQNPWIDRRHFDTLRDRCVEAENMCRQLINVIAVDDGEFLDQHGCDYLIAGQAILRGEV